LKQLKEKEKEANLEKVKGRQNGQGRATDKSGKKEGNTQLSLQG
jgi:hypothetical protein